MENLNLSLDDGLYLIKLVVENRKKTLKKARKENKFDGLDNCDNKLCRKKGTKLCSSCEFFAYCSLECHKKHWKIHKNLCKEINFCVSELQSLSKQKKRQ